MFANPMPTFDGIPANLLSILTKNIKHPPTKSKLGPIFCVSEYIVKVGGNN